MADSSSNELPRARSEYIPPTTIPPAVSHATIPDERVRIAGQPDRRLATTVLSRRAAQRTSRHALWSLIAAAAFGAGLAALLFVRHFNREEAAPPQQRSGVTTLEESAAAPRAPGAAALAQSSAQSSNAGAAVADATAQPAAEALPPKAATPETQRPSTGKSVETPAAPSAPLLQSGTDGPPNAAMPNASGNKAWLKPPERKVWLD